MHKVLILIAIIFSTKSALAQDYDKIAFITDKSQTYWLFGESKISNLSQLELTQLEDIIQTKITEHNNKVNKQNNINSNDYFRQYIIIENNRGEKEVWINFLCEVGENDKWKNKVIIVDDGGKCYFNIIINLTKKAINRFIINGRA